MKYVSTRSHEKQFDFEQVIRHQHGYPPDGGLFVPVLDDQLSQKLNWRKWADKSYPDILIELLKVFVGDESIPYEKIVADIFRAPKFENACAAPVKKLSDNLFVLELFYGPTFSQHDFGKQTTARLYQYYAEKHNDRSCLLCEGCGDECAASIEAIKECPNLGAILLYPSGTDIRDTEIRFLARGVENVRVFGVDASLDDLDRIVRKVAVGQERQEQGLKFHRADSSDWPAVLTRLASWFYGYWAVTRDGGAETVTFLIPTNGGGECLTAGLYAQKLGLPVKIIVCANRNDALHTFFRFGRLQSKIVQKTVGPSMDVQVPCNIERIIYLASDGDYKLTGQKMTEFHSTRHCSFSFEFIDKLHQLNVVTCSVSDDEIYEAIKWADKKYSYQSCPYTAATLYGARRFQDKSKFVCIAATAPQKFPEIFRTLGCPLSKNPRFEDYVSKFAPIEPDSDATPCPASVHLWSGSDLDRCAENLREEILKIQTSRSSNSETKTDPTAPS